MDNGDILCYRSSLGGAAYVTKIFNKLSELVFVCSCCISASPIYENRPKKTSFLVEIFYVCKLQ